MAKVGDVIQGTVKNVHAIGVFVDIDQPRDGLVRTKELEGRKLTPGERVQVKVSQISEDGRISLTLVDETAPATSSKDSTTAAQNRDWWILGNSFYVDDSKEVLNEELFTHFTPRLAEEAANAPEKGLTTNALRNFYDAVKQIESSIVQAGTRTAKEAVFRRQLPHIKLLKAKVAHYQPQGRPKIPKVFADFLYQCTEIVNDLKDFEGFVLVFEAMAGWDTKFARKEGDRE